jgi:hypothetical protein
MQHIALTEGPASVAGAVTLEQTDGGVKPWRLPFDRLDLFDKPLVAHGEMAAGVRVTLVSDTSTLELHKRNFYAGDAFNLNFDLCVDGSLHQRVASSVADEVVRFTNIPQGEHRLDVYLPMSGAPTVVRGVAIDDGASATTFEDTRPKWVVYGSSITQCAAAAGPSETWPAIVSREFDLNLTCLGYGGNCQLEPLVAMMIRDLPADYISLCLGINVIGANSYSDRTFRAAVLGLISIIREKHPTTPMVVVSPISNPPREEPLNKAGMNLVKERRYIAEAVDILKQRGDEHIHLVNGLDLFGPHLAHHMPDQLHPDAEGYRVLAKQYASVVMPHFAIAV